MKLTIKSRDETGPGRRQETEVPGTSNQIFVSNSQVCIDAGTLEFLGFGGTLQPFEESSGQREWGCESGATCQTRPRRSHLLRPVKRGMRGEGAYRFVCGSRGRDLARANRVAEWVAALLWAICFRE